jgi:hypothetical protein
MTGGCVSTAGRIWAAMQVELQGEYSVERLRLLHSFSRASVLSPGQIVLVLVITPLPCLAINLLLDSVTLNRPSAGADDNLAFWCTSSASSAVCCVCLIELYKAAIPTLQLSSAQVFAITVIVTVVNQSTSYILSTLIGFPVPFIITLVSPVFLGVLMASLSVVSGKHVRDTPTARSALKEWATVVLFMNVVYTIYSLLNHAFVNASLHGQAAITLLVTAIKFAYKYAVSNCIREQADRRPEIVNFYGEIFNALFATFSMQNASSTSTIAVLLVVDALHAYATFFDVRRGAGKIAEIESRLLGARSSRHLIIEGTEGAIIDKAVGLLSRRRDGPPSIPSADRASPIPRRPECSLWSGWGCIKGKVKVVQTPLRVMSEPVQHNECQPGAKAGPQGSAVPARRAVQPSDCLPPTAAAENEYVDTVRRLLYTTEFVVLAEMVEFIVPVIYGELCLRCSLCFTLGSD